MSLSITTLNNEAAVAKTFTEISADRNYHEWLNTTDYTTTFDQRIIVKQQLAGKSKQGVPLRRSLVQAKCQAPVSIVVHGDTVSTIEEIVANLTILTPVGLASLTATNRKDLIAFLRNFVTATVCEQLARGEV